MKTERYVAAVKRESERARLYHNLVDAEVAYGLALRSAADASEALRIARESLEDELENGGSELLLSRSDWRESFQLVRAKDNDMTRCSRHGIAWLANDNQCMACRAEQAEARAVTLQSQLAAAQRDTERLDYLDRIVQQGGCPGLINDDAGHWAVSHCGVQNVPDSTSDSGADYIGTTFFVTASEWKNSVREAIDADMYAAPVIPT